MSRVPKSLVQDSAFTAASLLSRLINRVQGRVRDFALDRHDAVVPEADDDIRVARVQHALSAELAGVGARFSVGIALVATLCMPAPLRASATISSCASLPSWRRAVPTLRAAISAADANTAAARSSAVGSRFSEIQGNGGDPGPCAQCGLCDVSCQDLCAAGPGSGHRRSRS